MVGSENQFTCDAHLYLRGQITDTEANVIYKTELTPKITKIYPRYGTVKGGTSITFEGTDLPSAHDLYEIHIDGVLCKVIRAAEGSVTCVTGPRPGLPAHDISVNVNKKGRASIENCNFEYVNLWSDRDTWGGEYLPTKDEMVHVPSGLNLLVDVDETPVLSAVLVEGSLIFISHETDEDHHRKFNC